MEENHIDTAVASGPKVGRYSRNRSIMKVTDDPLLAAAASADLKVEVLNDAVLISEDAFNTQIISVLKAISVNEERISKLDEVKQPHLFTSFQLETLCNLTPSLKTKLEFIKIVGPRLVDPATSISTFMDMFRYTEEKLQVEQVLKERTFVISKAQFTDTRRSSNILSSRGGRGGAGGRGARSSLISNENSTPATPVLVSTSVSTVPTTGTTADTTATSPLHQQRKSAAMSLFQFADAANHEIEDNKTDNTTIDSTLSNALDKCEVK